MKASSLLVTLITLGIAMPALAQSKKIARLDKGEIIVTTKEVEGFDIPKVRVEAVINAAPEKVWAIIEKCDNYEKTMIGLSYAEELSRRGTKVMCKTVADLPWPLDDLTGVTLATHTVIPGKKWKRAWKLIKGDFKFNTGSWTLTPFNDDPNRTHIVYRAHVEPTTSVPDSVKTMAAKSTLPDLIRHLRSQVE
jgi:ribosome-associated toxin RatA of RatAB toxin-antitoxin module